MPVSDFCKSNVVSVVPESTLQEAADIMASRSVGCLVVADGGDLPIGVITDRDIVIKAVAKDVPMSRERVGSIMSRDLVTIPHNAGLSEAVELMRRKEVRRLIITGPEAKACGVLSADDLIQIVGSEIDSIGELYLAQDGTSARHRNHDYSRMA